MSTSKETENFNRSKIYEKLDYLPEPAAYNSKLPWTVQCQVAATNGVHYVDRLGKLKDYPLFELPTPAVQGQKLMLDIGNGWGRWLVAGANKGYTPIGIDIRLEFCQTARKVLADLGKTGFTVVADLENLPFRDDIFDLVWSFSVIQHTHRQRLENCLSHINRILSPNGFTLLEFPNKNGIRNQYGPVAGSQKDRDNYNSWVVRYYSPEEYQQIISQYLDDFSYSIHSFLGIGVLKEDLKYVSLKNKLLCATSLSLTQIARLIAPMQAYADSIYVQARKKSKEANIVKPKVLNLDPKDNLSILPLLICPKYGGSLTLDKTRKRLLNDAAGVAYPIEGEVPILIGSEAVTI
jgi:ubiquinone/menaquinone biosynthesis C-methylase UbiE/uncharacterized protein YbaR (Trm112 family)